MRIYTTLEISFKNKFYTLKQETYFSARFKKRKKKKPKAVKAVVSDT